jgi:hypothetical protein
LCPYAWRCSQSQRPCYTGQSIAKEMEMSVKRGLYSNIHAKRDRIKAGSGEKMRKVGSKGAPTSKAFKQSARTAKRKS